MLGASLPNILDSILYSVGITVSFEGVNETVFIEEI